MKQIRDDLDHWLEQLSSHIEVSSSDATDAAFDRLDDVRADLHRLRSPNAYEEHLIDYLQEAKEAFEAGERETLCTCGNPYCAVKRGKVPPRVLLADSLEDGITRYKGDHSGRPVALVDARDEFLEHGQHVIEQVQQARAELNRANES